MNNHFLTSKYYFKGWLGNILEKILAKKNSHQNSRLKNFNLIQWLKLQNEESLTSVGFFKSEKYGKVVIKCLRYSFKNLAYEQIINEMSMLKTLNALLSKQFRVTKVNVPKVYELIQSKNFIGFAYEFKQGKNLSQYPVTYKLEVIKKCLTAFNLISKKIDKKNLNKLPKKTSSQTFFSFPIYLGLVWIRDLKSTAKYIGWLGGFYYYYLPTLRINPEFILSHRDLHSQNILINNKIISIIDPEIAMLSETGTDLAILSKNFAKELGVADLVNLIKELAKTDQQKKRYLALAIYYSIQMMAIRSQDDPDYIEAKEFIYDYLPEISRELGFAKQAPAEMVLKVGLKVLVVLNNLLKRFIFFKQRPIVLCYHSVNDHGWRFSVNTAVFEGQMKYLKENFRVVSLDEIVKGKAGVNAVAVTFDDGYLDTLTNAALVLKKYKFPATLFVLGDNSQVNRAELGNQQPILSLSQIKRLKKTGWEIGFHTKTHSDLRSFNHFQLEEEISKSRKELEKKLGFKIKYFAYPRGLYNNQIITAVKRAGFKAAFTVDADYYRNEDPILLKDRVSIEKVIGVDEFSALLSPLGIYFIRVLMSALVIKEKLTHKAKSLAEFNKTRIRLVGIKGEK